ncbi:hypothetical protein [Brevundimonas denitrificans]|uniref:hypothetical protein n=1 Tax=Brevundimonas denitrificans TaxID=1443434 RepID=UPI00223B5783|nr:hypothetical protein [Brevundimonas denitrificans]
MTIRTKPWLAVAAAAALSLGGVACTDAEQAQAERDAAEAGETLEQGAAELGERIESGAMEAARGSRTWPETPPRLWRKTSAKPPPRAVRAR